MLEHRLLRSVIPLTLGVRWTNRIAIARPERSLLFRNEHQKARLDHLARITRPEHDKFVSGAGG